MRRLTPRCRSVVLLGFLAIVILAAPEAAVRVVWRSSVLSFDNPATQVLDELASQKAPRADPLLEADAALRTAASSSRRLALARRAGPSRSLGLCCLEARAPPAH
jgi:hypothetical protein